MSHAGDAPKTIGEVIDELEQIQERLLQLQRSLEKMETVEAAVSSAEIGETPSE
jgi:protein-arginine kinase activator protein McsA